jgi:uncharacterized protein YbcC (UPF0753/DUF2309 family)
MFLLHITYIPLYFLCHVFTHRYFRNPEFAAALILSFLMSFSFSILYQLVLPQHFTKQLSGYLFLFTLIMSSILTYGIYIKKDAYKTIIKKYRATWLPGTMIDLAWTYFVYHYMAHHYHADIQ